MFRYFIAKLPGFILFAFFFVQTAAAQKISFSAVDKMDWGLPEYQVVGKVGANYLVFKSAAWRKILLVYDKNMNEVNRALQKYMPDEVLKITSIPVDDHVFVIYRYARKNMIYCDAVKLDAYGKRMGAIIRIDSMFLRSESAFTRYRGIDPNSMDDLFPTSPHHYPPTTDNRSDIYSVVSSADRSKILVYKLYEDSRVITMETKIFDRNFQMLDTGKITRASSDERYSKAQVANDGTIFFYTQTGDEKKADIRDLQLFARFFKVNNYVRLQVDLQEKLLTQPEFKIDDLNKSIVINSFYLDSSRGRQLQGIFSFKTDTRLENIRVVFNDFPPALSSMHNYPRDSEPKFEQFKMINLYFRQDGSYQLIAGRRGINGNFSMDTVATNSLIPEIIFLNIDTALHTEISTLAFAKDLFEQPQLISAYTYQVLNLGSRLELLINSKSVNGVDLVQRGKIAADTKISKYPLVRIRKTEYDLLPQFLKQVDLKEAILPFQSKIGRTGFALLELQD